MSESTTATLTGDGSTVLDITFDAISSPGTLEKTITLNNPTNEPMTNLEISFSDSSLGYKGGSFPGSGGTCEKTLEASQSCTVVVSYSTSQLAAKRFLRKASRQALSENRTKLSQLFIKFIQNGIAKINIINFKILLKPLVNRAPVAVDIKGSTNKDKASEITLIASDEDNDILTYAIVTDPAHGSVSINGVKVNYQPSTKYYGADSFTFKVNDGNLDSNIATVSITVEGENDAPVAKNSSLGAVEDLVKDGVLLASDPDGTQLIFSIVSNGTKGTVTLIDTSTGMFSYAPNANENGVDIFTFQVSDGSASSFPASVSIEISGVNDAPQSNNASLSVTEDIAQNGTLNGSDLDANLLTYSIVSDGSKGTAVITNSATGEYTYTPKPDENGEDSFTFKTSDGSLDSNTATVSVSIAPVEDTYKNVEYEKYMTSLKDRALVIYNTNATGSEEIAKHYQTARGLNSNQLCPVKMPSGSLANKQQFLSARKEILENCICLLIPESVRPSPCNESKLDEIALKTPISHLVLIRGVPHLLYGTGWPTDSYDAPSLDYYLGVLLYRDANAHFTTTNGNIIGSEYKVGNLPEAAVPNRPSITRTAVFGRIDGLTVERAKNLIDRTIVSEQKGFQGNVYWQNSNSTAVVMKYASNNPLPNVLMHVTDSFKPECRDYTATNGVWPLNSCSSFFTPNGYVPGVSQLVPNAGAYFGSNPWTTLQAPFSSSFLVAQKWRVDISNCKTLCSQTSDPIACMSSSKDFFKVLNTDCVGVSEGFIGGQHRSYPVKYYGVSPPGWITPQTYGAPITPPREMIGDAYMDANFVDDHYIRVGGTSISNPLCLSSNGNTEPCPERLAFSLLTRAPISPKVHPDGTYKLKLKFRMRNTANPIGSKIKVIYMMWDDYNVSGNVVHNLYVDMGTARTDWTLIELPLTVSAASIPARSMRAGMELQAWEAAGLSGTVDFDAFEWIDEGPEGNQQFLTKEAGSFSGVYTGDPEHGESAAWMLDRMGGIGWWGSGSHFITNGNAFVRQQNIALGFFGGLSLGEAVYLGTYGMSGTIYADPLYRPTAAALYLDGTNLTSGAYPLTETSTYFSFNPFDSTDKRLLINAYQGSSNLMTTHWQVKTCVHLANAPCNTDDPNWVVWKSGVGATFGEDVSKGSILNFVSNKLVEEYFDVKLTVWQENTPNQKLTSRASFRYYPSVVPVVNSILLTGSNWTAGTSIPLSMNSRRSVTRAGANRIYVTLDRTLGVEPSQWKLDVKGIRNQSIVSYVESIDHVNKQIIFRFPSLDESDLIELSIGMGDTVLRTSKLAVLPGNVSDTAFVTNPALAILDSTDITLMNTEIAKTTTKNIKNYDLNLDGQVTSADLTVLLNLIASGQTTLPSSP